MVDVVVRTGDKLQSSLSAALLALALLLGGGQGGLGDTLLQLLAIALLAYLFAAPGIRRELLSAPTSAWLALVVLALPLLQLLPIPMGSWLSLDGRATLAAQLSSVAVTPDPHLALQALGAERALWSLLPAVALYLSALSLPLARQRQLMALVLVLAFLSLVLGLLQLAGGPDSGLYFYRNTNLHKAVGFFANSNHLAALLVMALPLALATVAHAVSQRSQGQPVGLLTVVAATGLAIALLLGIALSHSRGGLLLGMLGLLLSLPMIMSLRSRRGVKRVFGVIVAIALLLTVQFGLFGILQRLQSDPLGDQRWQIAKVTVQAARQHAPTGSGLGSFRQVFQALDTEAPGDTIVNHAHDDFLELWLEAGWPFLAVAGIFIGLILWAGIRAWRSGDGQAILWAKAASISLLLVVLHSALDYPLRTSGNQAVFALLLAVLLSRRLPVTEGAGAPAQRRAKAGPAIHFEKGFF